MQSRRGFRGLDKAFVARALSRFGWDAAHQRGRECSSGIGIEVGYLGLEGRSCQIRRPSRLPNYQIGLPSLSRKTNVSFPRWISRAKMVSTSSNFTFEPMTSIASPLLKTSS